MNCPVCHHPALEASELMAHLDALRCPQCEGKWLPSVNYRAWLAAYQERLPERAAHEIFEIHDDQSVKLCPECRRILLRYKVKADLGFLLDHCSSCNGVWFDKNEWEALASRHLHDELHLIFTEPWQRKVEREESRLQQQRLLKRRLGEEDYEELKRVYAWLWAHPQHHILLAHLSSQEEVP